MVVEPLTHEAERLTPTGLTVDDLAGVSQVEKSALWAWMTEVAGNDDGRPWWPYAIRKMPVEDRLALAMDPILFAAWRVRERRRVERDPVYFTTHYGSVQPESGSPIPFLLWDHEPDGAIGAKSQEDAVRQFRLHLRIIILKARQLGLTWAALHDAVHVLAFDQATPNARVLALSKHGGDASKLLERARKIIMLLPEFLRPREDVKTRESKTELQLVGRGKMVSLAGSPAAARMETATLVLLDEFAHIKNKGAEDTWTAVIPTMGRRGRAIIIFTGNGPAETPGDGQTAARLWQRAREGDEGAAGPLHPIFLPSSSDPTRTPEWHAERRKEFLNPEDFEAEYAETEDQALAGKSGDKVYPPSGISAAVMRGRELDRQLWDGSIAEPAGGLIHATADFGEATHLLPLWPLEGGGLYVPPGEVVGGGYNGMTVRDGVDALHENISEWQLNADDEPWVLIGELRYDSAGVESARTFCEVVEEQYVDRWEYTHRVDRRVGGRIRTPRRHSVAFGKFKGTAIDYLRYLFKRTADGEMTGIIAISPENKELIRQLRGYELKDDDSGKTEKGDDHGPDSLAAGAKPIAVAFRKRVDEMRERRRAEAEERRHAA